MRLLFDIETNGFLEELDRVHCLVIVNLDTQERWSCTDANPRSYVPSIEAGLELLVRADRIYGHNILGFDLPALKKVYPGWDPKGEVLDTLVMSRVRFAHLKEMDYSYAKAGRLPGRFIGAHSLEAWGYRLGIMKDDYQGWCERNGIEEPFAVWRPEMQSYCDQDVVANQALLDRIRNAGAVPQAVRVMEHKLARYLIHQEAGGWPFDFERAVRLQGALAHRREYLGNRLRDHFGTWLEGGKVFTPQVNNAKLGYVGGAPMTRLKAYEFNPASRQHIANRLIKLYGWEPTEFTPSGQPKVDESTLKGLSFPESDALAEYLMVDKRLGQLAEGKQAWLGHMNYTRAKGGALTGMPHIHHAVSNTTITHRHRHSHPNVGQVPSLGVPYGEACRMLWRVPPEWVMVGVDASGLELRCLAHYMARYDDGAYGKIILEGSNEDGTDIHSVNAAALGSSRPEAKVFIYAYLYGAGNTKLGSILQPLWDEDAQGHLGKKLRRRFEDRIPALGSVVSAVKKKAVSHQYLLLIDGRRAYCRSPHSALNVLLQGTGSVACKWWIAEFGEVLEEEFGPMGWDGEWQGLAWVHDEVQIAVRNPDNAPRIGELIVGALNRTGQNLGFRLPLDGEYKIGSTWADTH